MAVQAVCSMVIQKLTEESTIYKKKINGVKSIITILTEMQSFVKNDEDEQQSDETVKKWVSQFVVTVYDVEEVIETFCAATTRLRRKCFVKQYSFFVKEMWNCLVLWKNIRRIKKSIMELDPSKPLPDDQASLKWDEQLQPQQIISSNSVEYVEALVTQLTNTSDQHLRVFSIIGSGSSGKTTLAMTIYSHSNIKEHFDILAWVSVSKCSVTYVLIIILKQISGNMEEKMTCMNFMDCSKEINGNMEEKMTHKNLMKKLRDCLKEKRYLVVMDDVWSHNVWKNLRRAFPDKGNGSRVMFTTGNEDVASFAVADPSWHYQIKPQDEDDQYDWNLFLDKLRSADTNQLPESEKSNLKEKIVEKFNQLPVHLRPCFLYFGLFPREYEIPVSRLFRLWLAEGFVNQSQLQPGMTLEDLGENYLEDLVNRKVIQIASRRLDGSFKTCHMPSILYDIFLSKALDISLFYIHRTSDYTSNPSPPRFGIHRLIEHVDIKYYPHSELYIKHLRSYISFTFQERGKPAVEISKFISRSIGSRGFRLLRVLDLEGVYKPRLPEEVGNLFHLRYLGLRWTFLDSLPSSIGNLPYLQTLDVKHTYINTLPSSIWKMKYLRHLCLNEIRLDISVLKLGFDCRPPTQLQTLWGLFVDKKSPVKKGLDRLINLRKLGLTCHSDSVEELFKWIVRLTSLQYLKLRSKDDLGRTSKIDLKPLLSLEHLAHLYLLGTLPTLLPKNEFPPNLKVLTLSISQLTDDPMPTLAELPSLRVLRLFADSYTGKQMVCPGQGFGALQVLKLWMLADLEEWIVEDGAMQNLRELEIRCCSKLKLFPDRLLNMSTMEKLIFTTMPEEFVADVKAKQHDHSIITINNWDFASKSATTMI